MEVGFGRRWAWWKASGPPPLATALLVALALFAALALQAALAGSARAAAAPTVESESVSNVTATDATLEAAIDPQSAERGAYYQFQVVLDPSEYLPKFACPSEGFPAGTSFCVGLESEPHALALGLTEAGTEPLQASLDVATARPYWMSSMTLEPSTTYHYRVIVARSKPSEDQIEWEEPIVYGADQTFTTPEAPPPPPPPPPPPSGSPPPSGEGSTPSAPPPVPVALSSQEVKPNSAPVKHHRKHRHKRRHRRHRHHGKHHRGHAHRRR